MCARLDQLVRMRAAAPSLAARSAAGIEATGAPPRLTNLSFQSTSAASKREGRHEQLERRSGGHLARDVVAEHEIRAERGHIQQRCTNAGRGADGGHHLAQDGRALEDPGALPDRAADAGVNRQDLEYIVEADEIAPVAHARPTARGEALADQGGLGEHAAGAGIHVAAGHLRPAPPVMNAAGHHADVRIGIRPQAEDGR